MLKIPSDFARMKGVRCIGTNRVRFARYLSAKNSVKFPAYMETNALIFVFEGTKILHTQTGDFEIKPKEAIFLSRGNYLLSDKTMNENGLYQSFLFFFDDALLIEFLNKNRYVLEAFEGGTQKSAIFKIRVNELLQSALKGFFPYFDSTEGINENILRLKFEEIFLHLLNDRGQNGAFMAFLKNVTAEFGLNFKKIFECCERDFSGVGEMASFFKTDVSTFSRKFKQSFGMSPKQWLDEKRLSKARFLILFSQKNIGQICLECGFSSPAWFIERFKNKYGITPKQLQKSNNLYFVS